MEVHLVLYECLQLLYTTKRIFSELCVPLLIDFQWILCLLNTYPFFDLFLSMENAGDCFINFVLELVHRALQFVDRVIDLVSTLYDLAGVRKGVL